MEVTWRDAERQQCKASIVIEGLSGSGKSGLALFIAYILSGKQWDKVYDLDTENKSLDLFNGVTLHNGETIGKFRKFDLLPTHGYAPTNYVKCKESAKNAGAEVFVQDSITHMWTSEGGVLGLVSEAKANDKYMDNYRVWGLPRIVEQKNAIFKTIRDADVHVISTVRVKEKYEYVTGIDGKNSLQSVGEQELQMPGLNYEPDLVLHMVSPGTSSGEPPVARVIKTRYTIFNKGEQYRFTEALVMQLKQYLEEGVDPSILREEQRVEYVNTVTSLLDNNTSSQAILPAIKEQLGCKDVPLKDMKLEQLQQLYSILIS